MTMMLVRAMMLLMMIRWPCSADMYFPRCLDFPTNILQIYYPRFQLFAADYTILGL